MGRASQRKCKRFRARLEKLEPRSLLAGVIINEFMALNDNGLLDQDSDRSDWVELRNTDPVPADITGWHLTDDALDLDKWQFPSTTIPANGYLVLFASGKDRAVSGQQLHTNFSLDAAGEYLALVMPDGTSVAHAYDPFPAQLADISYGVGNTGTVTDSLIDEEAAVQVRVPTAASAIDSTWDNLNFTPDGTWLTGTTGVGYDTVTGSGTNYEPYVNLNIESQMRTHNATAYIRLPFDVADPAALTSLTLMLRYDDGFGLYLNGTRLNGSPNAERNAPATLAWNSTTLNGVSRTDSQAIIYETIDLTSRLNLLVAGQNVLAIHGLNSGISSNDFLMDPLLEANRTVAGSDGFMTTPTPGANNSQGTLGFVDSVGVSVDRGFFDNPFNVTLSNSTSGAQIRYTLDGSAPSATTGSVYAAPIPIDRTTNLRAAAFKSGFTPSPVNSQTYIFLDQVIQQTGAGLPGYAPWGHDKEDADTLGGVQGDDEADWSMDTDVTTNPLYSGTIKNDLQSVPSISLSMPWSNWFGAGGQGIYISGTNIERQGSVEWVSPDNTQEFQIDAALEIQGGSSTDRWKTDKLSIRVTFKQPFGPTSLNTVLFNNPAFDQHATTNFDTFILDAQINFAWTYAGGGGAGATAQQQRGLAKFIQDQHVSDLQNLSGGQAPHGRVVNLYLNGLYWGIYMLHERPDDSFAEEYLGGDKDDYDVLKHTATTVVSGDTTAIGNYANMLAAVRADMTVGANYQAVQQLLDVDGFIDYMLVNYYVGNADWAHHNWYATFNRVDPTGRWRFHSWDAEHVLRSPTENVTARNDSGAPTEIQNRLMVNPEYRMRFNDRVQRLFFNGGALTPAKTAAAYQARMAEVDRAIVAESARWGDNANSPNYTPLLRSDWLATQNDLLANYFPNRTANVLAQFAALGWLTSVTAPSFSQFGGSIPNGYQLTMSALSGTIYYTLDGTDPRLSGGAISGSAIQYTGAVTLDDSTRVIARALSGGTWSAVVDATFLTTVGYPLRITELHYNPANHAGVADAQDIEFIELVNTGSQTVSLDGVRIEGFSESGYEFGDIDLGPGEYVVVARNPAVFQFVYGGGINLAPTGYATANLSNGGEQVLLKGPLGETLQDIVYDDASPWPTTPDGGGYSLEIIDPVGDPTSAANWRASLAIGGSPGADGIPPVIAASGFHYETGHTITFQFDRDMDAASLDPTDVNVQLLPSGTVIHPTSVSYNPANKTATFAFATALADGNYTATLLAGSVRDAAGDALASNSAAAPFFVLAGDADHDRDVDVNDLGILASNWQQSPRTFAQGDFDYSGTVDVNDLGILASHWQQDLPAPSAPAARRTPSRLIEQVLSL